MKKRMIGFVLKIAVTTALFVLLFRPETYGLSPTLFGGVAPTTLLKELRGISWAHLIPWLIFAALVKLCGMLAGILRWRLLLAGQSLRLPFGYLVQSWFVGRALGVFLPSTLGLDGYRLYDTTRYTHEGIKCATVIAVEKLTGFISLTLLVFLTFPLGFRLLRINAGILAVILLGLGGCVLLSFILLLKPRSIQLLLAVFPVPPRARHLANRVGTAVTRYHGQRRLLLGAVMCALLVHLGTCFMFFGTMMAIRAENTGLLDILFASPIMIYGTVIGPSIGGEGIREIVFATLLGSKSGVAPAVLFAHLGWWIGEVLPALLGALVFVVRVRSRKEIDDSNVSKNGYTHKHENTPLPSTNDACNDVPVMQPDEIARHRRILLDAVLVGMGAGLIAGTIASLFEAWWVIRLQQGLVDHSAFWWGPLVYGLLFAGIGGTCAFALNGLMFIFEKTLSARMTFSLCFGGILGVVVLMMLTVWVNLRDALGHAATRTDFMLVCMAALTIAILGVGTSLLLTLRLRIKRSTAILVVFMLYSATVLGGKIGGAAFDSSNIKSVFVPQANVTGPNVILIAVDTLRADYLSLFASTAKASTPNLEALARNAVVFDHCIAQAPWTKPAFASIFSGQYPSVHKADTELASLPDNVTTFPQILSTAGYYTKGFANNAHISTCFKFDRGFTEYTDLKPQRLLWAGDSASRLTIYEGIRRIPIVFARNRLTRVNVREAYQPAENVTQKALAWLDGLTRPKTAPFLLFLHYMDPHDPYMDHAHPGVGYAHVRLGQPNAKEYLDRLRNAYNSEITYLDKWLGTLFTGLRQRGLYDNTLVVFVADHGEEFYDHKGWWHGRTLYDEMVHVPLLIKYPGNRNGGTHVTTLARQIDIAPTILEVAGAKEIAGTKPVKEMVGRSLVNPDKGPIIEEAYSENNFEDCLLQSLRTPTEKLILANPDNPRGNPERALFDLIRDPGEQENLAGKGNACELTLTKRIDDMMTHIAGTAAVPAKSEPLSPEVKEQLEAVGYLGGQ